MAKTPKSKKAQISHRIEDLRIAHELSQEELGEAIGRNKYFISRLENGAQELDLPTAIQVANHFGVELNELLVLTTSTPNGKASISADVRPYKPQPGEKPLIPSDPNHLLYVVETDVCANLGYQRGDVIEINPDRKTVRTIRIGEAAVVAYNAPGDTTPPRELLREFVPPNLLITNAKRGDNARSIDLSLEDAQIIGIVVGAPRRARSVGN